MTRSETLAVMSILKAAYPGYYRDMKRQDAEAVVNLWAEMLADYPANLVAAAVKAHIAGDQKGFPPHIGAIIASIGEVSKPAELTEGEAWAMMDAGTVQTVVQSNFLRCYRARMEAEKRLAAMPSEIRAKLTNAANQLPSFDIALAQRTMEENA